MDDPTQVASLQTSPMAENAYLVAAAPDLLRELREAYSMLRRVGFDEECDREFKTSWNRALRRIRAALAKSGATP